MEDDVKIISKHNLDCSSLESLANDIANRLGNNIEYGKYQNVEGKHEFVQYGIVEVVENNIRTTLYDLRNDENSSHNFVLELGEEAKVIYEDFIEFMPAWEEQYETVVSTNNSKGLVNDSFYNGVFDELQKLGADNVIFIKNTFIAELAIAKNETLENYLKTVQQNATFFDVIL
jgi:hypothetical protein